MPHTLFGPDRFIQDQPHVSWSTCHQWAKAKDASGSIRSDSNKIVAIAQCERVQKTKNSVTYHVCVDGQTSELLIHIPHTSGSSWIIFLNVNLLQNLPRSKSLHKLECQ